MLKENKNQNLKKQLSKKYSIDFTNTTIHHREYNANSEDTYIILPRTSSKHDGIHQIVHEYLDHAEDFKTFGDFLSYIQDLSAYRDTGEGLEGVALSDLTAEDLRALTESLQKERLKESMNDELNPKLFDEQDLLKEDVREGLIDIANTFIEDIKENDIPIEVMDLWLVGSNASYNYSDNSDIDVHIIANMDDIDCNGLLTIVYNYAKSDFNKKHKITVKGIPVEVYIESRSSSAITNGIYSLMNNEWVKFPEKINIDIDFDPDTSELYKEKFEKVTSAIESDSSEEVQKTIDDLYLLRKSALSTDGEFGEGNLVFKEFRNNGMLDELKDHKRELQDKELTLEAMNKNKNQLVITSGDPEKGMSFFNSAMGMGEQLEEDTGDAVQKRVYKIDDGHTITVKGNTVLVSYDDLYYERWYKTSDATWWEPAEWDYDEIEIEYTYKTGLRDLISAIWESLPLDVWDEADRYDHEVGAEDAWIMKNLDSVISKYGNRIIDTIREDAQDDAARRLAPEDTVEEPDFED